MGWVKLSTAFYRHPKALAAGAAGRNLYVAALAYCGEYDTDGKVLGTSLPAIGVDVGLADADASAAADRLVEVGLWDRGPDHWMVHDWREWQTTAEERAEKRRAEKERKARWRAAKAEQARDASRTLSRGTDAGVPQVSPLSDADADADAENTSPTPPPTRRGTPPRARTTTRQTKILNALAWEIARSTPGVRNVGALQATIVRNAQDEGLVDQLSRLLSRYPDADDDWIVREHLGRPHPLRTLTADEALAQHRATRSTPA